jgi:ATP-dependent protease ClpP protease subunit
MCPIKSSVTKPKTKTKSTSKKKNMKKSKEVAEEIEKSEEDLAALEQALSQQIAMMENKAQDQGPRFRSISLYGNIDEEIANDVIFSMMALKEYGKREFLEGDIEDPENAKVYTFYEPFDLTISTFGGSAADMFAIYDTIRMIRKDCGVHTFGLGKVMSAGSLAVGFRYQRKKKNRKELSVS